MFIVFILRCFLYISYSQESSGDSEAGGFFSQARGVFRNLSNIQGGEFCKNSWRFSAVNCFYKTLHLGCLTGLWIRLRKVLVKYSRSQNIIGTAQKMKFSIKDLFSKCDQIRSFLRIWSHLLKKSLIENFFFCAVLVSIFLQIDAEEYSKPC